MPAARRDEDCRLCGNVDSPHTCPHAAKGSMPEDMERELLAALNASPLEMWTGSEKTFSVDTFTLGPWTIGVFFDGCTFDDWDYVDHVIAPNGATYEPWPFGDGPALPVSIAFWHPGAQSVPKNPK